jgi:hypothetical protein
MRDKVKLHSVECFLHGMLVPQGYDLKALEPIGHLGAVFSNFDPLYQLKALKASLTAPYMRDKA